MNRRKYMCLAVLLLAVNCGAALALAGEPVIVNAAVQASRLISKVEPLYPEAARQSGIKGIVVLAVTIDEKGRVSQAKARIGDPSLYQAAIDAVKQWRYARAMKGGRAVAVQTSVSVPFGVPPAPEFYADANGKIWGPTIPFENIGELNVTLSTAAQISYETLDKALKEMQRRGALHLQLSSPGYFLKAGQLFYQLQDLQNPFLPAIGTNIQPPKLDVDLNSLGAIAAADGAEKTGSISTPFGTIVRPGIAFVVGVNAAGAVAFVERNAPAGTPILPETESALRNARVLRPAYLNGKGVPAAITVSITVR
jgi:TonB family protein